MWDPDSWNNENAMVATFVFIVLMFGVCIGQAIGHMNAAFNF